ncbi:AAA family ATPase [Motilibacter aurantiacus]|uniref:AAA family ATPase n=1 Tax=Motilibacter aurantiacus TaxID=2714955 RepID=UPI00140E43A9|nr:AAA family ATPase [Motilibacter aurantiacus]NHC47430.1 AAA family ATPase [Motilibacter aurantiacus]
MRLFGRAREVRAVAAVLEDAVHGKGGALVVRGPAGIGKTSLVERALVAVPRLHVVRAVGSEFETHLPFAGLQYLCQPLLGLLERLPLAQADALRGALGLGGTPSPDPVLLNVSLAALLTAAAQEEPLACVVDDVQWMDPSSVEALAFVARRAGFLRLALLLVARDGEGRDALDRLPALRVPPLDRQTARDLLAAEVPTLLEPQVRDRVVEEARGNPLALLELPRALGPDGLAGGFGLPRVPSVQGTIEAAFRQRIEELPDSARQFAALAAADPTGDASLLWVAAAEQGLTPRDALPLQDNGLLTIGARVSFRHPLVRAAAYEAAGLAFRRRAHAALGRATDREAMPCHRAWHLALAAEGPDEQTAQELMRSADRARDRGGYAAQAAFLERAGALTPDPAARAARFLLAAAAKRTAGAPDAALELLSVVEAHHLDEEQRVRARVLRARIRFDRERDGAAVRALLTAGQDLAAHDPETARDVLFDAYAAMVFMGRLAEPALRTSLAAALETLAPVSSRAVPRDLLLRGLLTSECEGVSVGGPTLLAGVRATLDDEAPCQTTAELWLGPSAALEAWDEQAVRTIAERQLRWVRARGALADLPIALSYAALVHLNAGDLDGAQALVDEANRVSAEIEAPPLPHVDMSIAAWRGDEERAERFARAALDSAAARQEGRLISITHHARAVLLNGLGRYDEALEVARESTELGEQSVFGGLVPELVEAAARAGRPEAARKAMALLEERAAAFESPWSLAVLARSRALLGPVDEADVYFRQALDCFAATDARAHFARTRLLYGEWLRREGRKREAREQLRTAAAELGGIGARAFEARAARELAATGERARPRDGSDPSSLTPQELTVARLVAAGATSKEAAAALFLSPRTIDAHLRNIFGKLGISSRRELSRMREALGPAPASDAVAPPRQRHRPAQALGSDGGSTGVAPDARLTKAESGVRATTRESGREH